MAFVIVFVSILFLMLLYFMYKSYSFQLFLHKNKVKRHFMDDFLKNVKGKFIENAYFGPSHQIISSGEYRSLSNRHKINFSRCYNVITFRTADAEMELYFNLIKEGLSFIEVFNLRVFPKDYRIKSEGNVEKNYSRINVFTNNGYLTKLLETKVNDNLKWLIRYNGDILLISSNNLHFKAFLDSKKLSVERVLDMVKAMHGIKTDVYKKDILEY